MAEHQLAEIKGNQRSGHGGRVQPLNHGIVPVSLKSWTEKRCFSSCRAAYFSAGQSARRSRGSGTKALRIAADKSPAEGCACASRIDSEKLPAWGCDARELRAQTPGGKAELGALPPVVTRHQRIAIRSSSLSLMPACQRKRPGLATDPRSVTVSR